MKTAHDGVGKSGSIVIFAMLPSRSSELLGKNVEVRGIPHLAKNERDGGHPSFVEGEESKRLHWMKALCSSMKQEFG
jgi:hypothetical protein